MSNVVDPRYMDVIDWTSQMTLVLDQYGHPGTLLDPADWRRWFSIVNGLIPLPSSDLPDPYLYADWRECAYQFISNTQDLLGA